MAVGVLIGALALCAPPAASQAQEWQPEEVICAPQFKWHCATMLDVAWVESKFDNTAVNPRSGTACWFQIHPMHGYNQKLLTSDPWACTYAAYDLWLAAGYTPWGR